MHGKDPLVHSTLPPLDPKMAMQSQNGAGIPMALSNETLAVSDGSSTTIFRAPSDIYQGQEMDPTVAWVPVKTPAVDGSLMALSPSQEESLIATLNPNNRNHISIWNAAQSTATQRAASVATLTVSSSATAVAFSADGQYVAVGCADGSVNVWQIKK